MKKIAAFGEAFYMNLIPHNNAGPLGTAATLHAALAIPNIALMEAPFVNSTGSRPDVVSPYPKMEAGFALPLEGPGLGITFDEKLARFLQNMSHRSLRVKRIQGTKNQWEGSVTMKYRFTFELSADVVVFRRIGTHDILNRESN